ncbi:MFS transporter [Rahnella inusitata]|uniref:MFS transporter n=1 Tax=Rahnella inusitata TaxID=58169 RepID=UPI0039AFFD9E
MAEKIRLNRQAIGLPLLVLCLAQFLASADNVTLSIATSALIRDLGASMSQISTANTMYPLVAGTFMIAGGMLGLIIGWRKTFRTGCILYFLAEIIAVFSPSITVFIWAARILAGIGGSLMIPAVFGIITGSFQGREQAIAFGALGAASGFSFAMGPVLCGLLLDTLGWRWAFGVLAGLAIVILVCSSRVPSPSKPEKRVNFDFAGFILSTLGLFLVVFGILQISTWGLITPFNPPFTFFGLSPALMLVASGLLILVVVLRWEKFRETVTGSAMIPQSFLRTAQVRAGLYLTMYIFFAYSSGIFVVVSFVQVVAGLDAVHTGLMIIPFAVCLAGSSMGLPLIFRQRNPRRQCRAGLLLGMAGSAITALGIHGLSFNTTIVTSGLCLIGASMGTVAANAPFLITSALPERDAQQSGGIQAAARDIGQALGVALVSMVMLTAMTFSMKKFTAEVSTMSPQTFQTVKNLTVIPYLSDAGFELMIVKEGANPQDLVALTPIYQRSRARVTRAGLFSMTIMTLLFLMGTGKIPVTLEGSDSNVGKHEKVNY